MRERNLIKIFKLKLAELGIRQTAVCQEAGKPESLLSRLFNTDRPPNIQTLANFIEAADRLHPGFADQYWLAVAGRPSIQIFVESMDSSELSVLLQVVSKRIAHADIRPSAKAMLN